MSITTADDAIRARSTQGMLPPYVGLGVYALLLIAGNRLLADPDTYWQITIGQWIFDHRAVPFSDRGFRPSGWRRFCTGRRMQSADGPGSWC
jgi:hypothetical protein